VETSASIVARAQNLPTISTTVAQLSRLIRDETATTADFENIIRLDPSLTANLLRLANSAYFGLRREVTSVKLAVTLLGLKRLFELVTSASFARLLPPRIPGYDMEATVFWRHSIAVAVLAEQLAHAMQVPAPNLLFTAGLLHDVGKLAIGNFLIDGRIAAQSRLAGEQDDLVEIERTLLGIDHQEVGEHLAAMWDLPDSVIWSARWHHAPSKAPAGVDRMLVDLVHVADGLSHSVWAGVEVTEVSRRVDNQALLRIGIRTNMLEKVRATAEEQINQLAGFCGNA
jgi:putative nucleotidyltransferase with HDIG domain